RMAMMAITTNSSMSVKAGVLRRAERLPFIVLPFLPKRVDEKQPDNETPIPEVQTLLASRVASAPYRMAPERCTPFLVKFLDRLAGQGLEDLVAVFPRAQGLVELAHNLSVIVLRQVGQERRRLPIASAVLDPVGVERP